MTLTASRLLITIAAAAFASGCNLKQGGPGRPARSTDTHRPPTLELPELSAPRPVPAARVVHLFHTSNVVGEVEPCG